MAHSEAEAAQIALIPSPIEMFHNRNLASPGTVRNVSETHVINDRCLGTSLLLHLFTPSFTQNRMDLNHPLLAATSDDLPSFLPTQISLQRLDRALYCQICKEFYQGPVSIACGHSFCSQVSPLRPQLIVYPLCSRYYQEMSNVQRKC